MAADDGASSPDDFAEKQLIQQVFDAGSELLQNLQASKEKLLEELQRLGLLLSNLDQAQSESIHEAIKPSIEALFADGLVQHGDLEVKISTAYCMSEILRITAPDEPCDNKSIKEFFQLAIMAFGKLANVEDRCYSKAESILQTFATYRLCVLMLDLELDGLIVEMFQLFLNSICPNNADALLPYMEAIMTIIIEDSEEISADLLNVLLTTAKKENQNPSNPSYVLGETVFRNCSVKLQLTWEEVIQRENLDNKELAPNSSSPRDVGSSDNQTPSTRRVRKPNSLMRPEEGYDLTWINVERKPDKTPCQGKASKKRNGRAEEENKPRGETSKTSKRKCSPSEKATGTLAEELVGCRIKVWVPKDEMFYEGSITSYDSSENKHKVNCDDGHVKDLNLSVERWEPIRDDNEQKPLAGVDDGKVCPIISMFQCRYSTRKRCFRMI